MGAGTMAWSFRAGQPTNATVTRMAFAMTPILRVNDRLFMELPPVTRSGSVVTAQGAVNAKKAVVEPLLMPVRRAILATGWNVGNGGNGVSRSRSALWSR